MKARLAVLVLAAVVATATAPAAAAPPAGRVVRVGLFYGFAPAFDPATRPADRALMEGLRDRGYVLGRNLLFEFRSAEGHPERMPALAAELVAARVDMIVTQATAPTLAAKGVTQAIPIIMVGAADPVLTGIVASLGFQQIEQAAPALGATIQSIRVAGSGDFDQAFAAMTQARPGASSSSSVRCTATISRASWTSSRSTASRRCSSSTGGCRPGA